MDKFENKNIILIIVLILLVIVIIFLSKSPKQNNEINNYNNISTTNNYIILTDANDFFTIESCVNRYINLLIKKDKINIIKLLDNKYQETNNINENNVLSKINLLDGIYNFNAKKIFVEKIDKNINNYYVYGKLKKDSINGNDLGVNYYLIIKMDKEKLLFSVTPYDGKIFKEEL